tara:strand:- start:34269 stop:34883 length:615 start_codon:yes stop_codon:yes gene_type:complete
MGNDGLLIYGFVHRRFDQPHQCSAFAKGRRIRQGPQPHVPAAHHANRDQFASQSTGKFGRHCRGRFRKTGVMQAGRQQFYDSDKIVVTAKPLTPHHGFDPARGPLQLVDYAPEIGICGIVSKHRKGTAQLSADQHRNCNGGVFLTAGFNQHALAFKASVNRTHQLGGGAGTVRPHRNGFKFRLAGARHHDQPLLNTRCLFGESR